MIKRRCDFSINEILASNWEKRLADDIAAGLELVSGEPRASIPEVRRFLAIKSYRKLLGRLENARTSKSSFSALRAVAAEMRRFSVEHPGLAAAAFRTPATDCPELRRAYQNVRGFMLAVLAECNLCDREGDDAMHILQSLARGFALHELMNSFLHSYAYDETYEWALDIFIAGLRVSNTKRSEIDSLHLMGARSSEGSAT